MTIRTTAELTITALHDGWTLSAAAGPVPAGLIITDVAAVVPGCVHIDLENAGLIPDPNLDANEAAVAWIGLVDWTYRCTFAWKPDGRDRQDLVFDGLDTIATIRVNGTIIGETANQHRSYRFDIGALLVDGDNSIEVSFSAPVPYANAQSLELGARPRPYPLPFEAMRKSASNFGWDWGIATFTSGIWRPARIESWSTARLRRVAVTASPLDDGGSVVVEASVERAVIGTSTSELTLTVEAAGVETSVVIPSGSTTATAQIDLATVDRWWPVGYGDQPLTEVFVSIADASGVLATTQRRVGFRTVTWDTEPDAAGTPFALVVNGVPVFVKGANWIPDDSLPARVDRARLERRLRQAIDANLNLIRVWGGGIYESEDFYDLCDELGLLSWQDFLFACAAYPEEEPIRSEVEAEARENIDRLAHRASLVLLTGNNENLWGFEDWGWKERLDGRTWGAYYYYDLFPALIAELAPHVPYAPGSPFSPGGQHPNAEAHGSMHLWEQWNRKDFSTYREHRPRFVAEFGWQGPPTWSTLTRAIHDSPLTPESPGMIVHQKALEGNVKLANGLLPHYRVPDDMDTWHWAMQLNQAVAVRTALEHFRSWAPHTMGAVVWQLNDCWPVTSWAAIDGDERAKPLFYGLRRAFAPRLVTIQPRGDSLAVAVSNDAPDAWEGTLTIRRLDFDGSELASSLVSVRVPARSTQTVAISSDTATPTDAARELLVAELGDERGEWFFAEGRDSALGAANLTLTTEPADGGTLVTISATTLARDVTLLVDKVNASAHVDEALITLLPGETTQVMVRHSGATISADALADPRVLRSANELVQR